MDQHILRFLTSKHKRSGPIYYFLPVLFGSMFPWSIFIPRATVNIWKTKELRLMLIWVFVVFTFFSVSGSKLPPYILPMFPPMAIILGYLFHEKWQSQAGRPAETFVYMIIFLVCGAGAFLVQIPPLKAYITDMSGDAAAILKDLRLFSFFLSLSSFAMLILLFFKEFTKYSRMFISLALFSLMVMTGLLFHLPVVDRLNTAKNVAVMINEQKIKADYIINYSG